MQNVFENCQPRHEVLSGDLREEIFAARLRDVVDGSADEVYQNPDLFFDNTYPTNGLRLLLNEALGRLVNPSAGNNAIIRLETAFGGGKTHNLIALYHAAKGYVPPNYLVAENIVPQPDMIKMACIVGTDLQPSVGIPHGNVTIHTLWGEMIYQLAGEEGFLAIAQSDRDKSAPGTEILDRMIGDTPTLIMIDEIARHLRAAKTVATATGRSDLAEQTSAFLMSLFEFAASRKNVVVVFTLAESTDAFGKENEDLKQQIDQVLGEIKRLSARQERVITPTAESEIAAIVCYRLFKYIDRDAARITAETYGDYYRHCAEQNADIPQRAITADYIKEIEVDYPFHPELLTTLNRKTSTIPNFQKTRGALRLLAMVVRDLWEQQPQDTFLIHPHHVNLGVDEIANDLTSRLERATFRQVIEADIISPLAGSMAHAQTLDSVLGAEPLTQFSATTILLHSIVQGGGSGIEASDLVLATIKPYHDPHLVLKAVERLVDKGWFIEYDGRRYRFKPEASINKIIAEEMAHVGQVPAKMELDHRIRNIWRKGSLQPVYFPSEPSKVDDDAELPKLVIIHFDAGQTTANNPVPPELTHQIFTYAGTQQSFRIYKNNLMFLVADYEQVENMVTVIQRSIAINRIIDNPQRMSEFVTEQRRKLETMQKAVELDVRIAITKTYRWLYYPSGDAPQNQANLQVVQLPPQDQGEVNQDQSIVILRVLKNLEKVITQDTPAQSAQFIKSKTWNKDQTEISTEELRRAFAKRMSLKMLLDINQLKKIISNGIQQNVWVYYDAHEQMGYNSQSPTVAVQISEETLLFTPEAFAQKNWHIKGVTPTLPTQQDDEDDFVPRPVGQVKPVGSFVPPVAPKPMQLLGEGAPAQAMQGILDTCADYKVQRIKSLSIFIEGDGKQGASEVRSLGLAIPQLGRAEFGIEQEIAAEFGQESLELRFVGGWERYKRYKQLTDSLVNEPDLALNAKTLLTINFPDGLLLSDSRFSTMRDVFSTLNFGHMQIEAQPFIEG